MLRHFSIVLSLTMLAACSGEEPVSAVASVENAQPILESASLGSGSHTVEHALEVKLGNAIDPNGDEIHYSFAWTVNEREIDGATEASLSSQSFKRGDHVQCVVTPSDGKSFGAAVKTESVTIVNTPPTLTSVVIGGGPYKTNDSISVAVDSAADPDGDTVGFSYQWHVNGAPVIDAIGATLDGPGFSRADVVYVRVTPDDGFDEGEAIDSNSVIIANTLPVLSSASIGTGPYYTDDTIAATSGPANDEDGDTVTYSYRWQVDGIDVMGSNGPTLSGAYFAKTQVVRVEITPHDQDGAGAPVLSNEVTIVNKAPSVASASIGGGPYDTDDSITVTAGTPVDPDGDQVTLTYRWFVDGNEVVGQTTATLPSTFFVRGQTVRAEVTPHDAGSAGAPILSNEITVANALPALLSADIGNGPYYTNDSISVTVGAATDSDGDTVGFTYQWYVNDSVVLGVAGATLDETFFGRGDLVYVAVAPSDGIGIGQAVNSNVVQIANSIPALASVTIEAGPFYTDSVITATPGTVTDDDGDAVSHTFRWLVDGVEVIGQNGASLSGVYFGKGQVVRVEATPTDQDGSGLPVVSSAVTIVNKPPALASAQIPPGIYRTNDTLQVSAGTTSDTDGDPVTLSYKWLVGGVEVAGQTGTSLSGLYFSKNQPVVAVVTPHDLEAAGQPAYSNTVTIANSTPSISVIAMHPGAIDLTSTLWAEVVTAASDADGDPLTYRFRWYGDGVLKAYPLEQTSVTNLGPATDWMVTVTAYDGTTEGAPAASLRTMPLTAVQVASSESHTCVVTAQGGVKCWGRNHVGQLGIGTNSDKWTPVDVTGLASGIKAITAAGSTSAHTCALTVGGGVKCWGGNTSGQLGNGEYSDRWSPVDVVGLSSGVIAISAGGTHYSGHTCALTTGGAVKCWGSNDYGKLGNGVGASGSTPFDVTGLSSGVTAISAGLGHSCALTDIGTIYCWGLNSDGQLGIGSTVDKSTPVLVTGIVGAVAIDAGERHTCAVTSSGGVKCWGANSAGAVGNASLTIQTTPVDVVGLTSGVVAVAAGSQLSCALLNTGGVKCWGYNLDGQLGNGNTSDQSTPVAVSGVPSQAITLSAGPQHACVTTAKGGLSCWGDNHWGQLGNYNWQAIPVEVEETTAGIQSVAVGGHHSCVLSTGGAVKCWGKDMFEYGRAQVTPVNISGLASGVTSITSGNSHTCALTSAGGVKCWGNNFHGQLGIGNTTNQNTPVSVSGLTSGVQAIAAGHYHTCALLSDGSVKCWGYNSDGQIGNGTQVNQSLPVPVSGLSNVIAIAAGYWHTCAVNSVGTVKCWGANGGQLGDGTTTRRLTPVDVIGITDGILALTAGGGHSCALSQTGGVQCWGNNSYGQLGTGNQLTQLTPVDVSGLTNGVEKITSGEDHTCALLSSGGIKCWGDNATGELGIGSTLDKLIPTDVDGMTTSMADVAARSNHVCAVSNTGGVSCWGDNYYLQLGNLAISRTVPRTALGFVP